MKDQGVRLRLIRDKIVAKAILSTIFGVGIANGCEATAAAPPAVLEMHLQFIGAAMLSGHLRFQDTPVGGLSGISYDVRSRSYLVVSDDPSRRGPARVYRMEVEMPDGRLHEAGLHLTELIVLHRPDGTEFPKDTIDPEGIAVAGDGTFYVSSEGNAGIGIAPSVRHFSAGGTMLGELPIPRRFVPDRTRRRGIRQNKGFEALTLTPDGRRVIVGTESSLRQDGPADDVTEDSRARLLVFDAAAGRELAEYVYPITRVSTPPDPPDGLKVKGLSELLAIDDRYLLALDRSFVDGRGNAVQLQQVDLAPADDVSGVDSLIELGGDIPRPVGKHTLLDFSSIEARLDNFEGMTFGPDLPDGRRLLVIISDNNFNWLTQVTEVLAFAVDTPGNPRSSTSPKQ